MQRLTAQQQSSISWSTYCITIISYDFNFSMKESVKTFDKNWERNEHRGISITTIEQGQKWTLVLKHHPHSLYL